MKRITREVKEQSRITKEEWKEYTKTVWQIANVTDELHPAVFPLEIPRRLIKLFTFVDEVVLDPFAGVGTTGKAALELNRRAICVDQNEDYIDRIKKENEHFVKEGRLQVFAADSRNLSFLDDCSVDLIVTSPPYWNKADYGDSFQNIGNIESYAEFLLELRKVFEECYRVLRPGRKIGVVTANVNQYTDYGLLTFPLAADFTILLRNVGFVMVAEVIWSKDGTGGRWGSANGQRPIFGSYPYPPNFLFKNIHEHILIFAKPPESRKRGKKVVSYAKVMGLGRNGVTELPATNATTK